MKNHTEQKVQHDEIFYMCFNKMIPWSRTFKIGL